MSEWDVWRIDYALFDYGSWKPCVAGLFRSAEEANQHAESMRREIVFGCVSVVGPYKQSLPVDEP